MGCLQIELGNNLLGIKFPLAVVCQLGSRHTGLCRLHISLGSTQSRYIRHLVDDKQYLSLAHSLPFFHTKPGERSRHLRVNVDVLSSADSRRISCLQFFIGCSDIYHLIFRPGLYGRSVAAGCQCCTADDGYHLFHHTLFCCHTLFILKVIY